MKSANNTGRIHNTIYNIIVDTTTGFLWLFIKICIMTYKFIKYVWYGILWPFILIVMLVSKIILSTRQTDIEKLRKNSQKLYEKEKLKEEKLKFKNDSYKNKDVKTTQKCSFYSS